MKSLFFFFSISFVLGIMFCIWTEKQRKFSRPEVNLSLNELVTPVNRPSNSNTRRKKKER